MALIVEDGTGLSTAESYATVVEADAYIDSQMVVEYQIRIHGITDLDVHGICTETSETNVLAVRGDWPELAEILGGTAALE